MIRIHHESVAGVSAGVPVGMAGGCVNSEKGLDIFKQVQDLYRAGPRDIVLLFLRLVLQNCCIHAAEILHIIC